MSFIQSTVARIAIASRASGDIATALLASSTAFSLVLIFQRGAGDQLMRFVQFGSASSAFSANFSRPAEIFLRDPRQSQHRLGVLGVDLQRRRNWSSPMLGLPRGASNRNMP